MARRLLCFHQRMRRSLATRTMVRRRRNPHLTVNRQKPRTRLRLLWYGADATKRPGGF